MEVIKFFTTSKNIKFWIKTCDLKKSIEIDYGDIESSKEYIFPDLISSNPNKEIEVNHVYDDDKPTHTVVIKGEIKNFEIINLPVTSIDATKCPALEYLGCYFNQLTSLDVSKNTALKDLSCFNNQLTSLDIE